MKKNSKNEIFTFVFLMLMFIGIKGTLAADDCNLILGDPNTDGTIAWYLVTGLNIFRWSAPVLVIIYGSIDIFKAVISPSADQMTKAQKTLIKRIGIALALFVVPSLVNLLLSTAGLVSCYKG